MGVDFWAHALLALASLRRTRSGSFAIATLVTSAQEQPPAALQYLCDGHRASQYLHPHVWPECMDRNDLLLKMQTLPSGITGDSVRPQRPSAEV